MEKQLFSLKGYSAVLCLTFNEFNVSKEITYKWLNQSFLSNHCLSTIPKLWVNNDRDFCSFEGLFYSYELKYLCSWRNKGYVSAAHVYVARSPNHNNLGEWGEENIL